MWILLLRPGRPRSSSYYIGAMYLMLATPVASIAVTAPYALQPRGDVAEELCGDVGTDNEEKKKEA